MLSRFIPNVRFTNPLPNRIAILHHDDYWIKELILKELPSTTVGVYPQNYTIYITPSLILRLILRLRLIDWLGVMKEITIKGLLREVYSQYVLACLDQIQAKVVLSVIDNSTFFHKLSQIDKNRVYFAIQNGTRTLACVRDSLPLPPHPSATISMSNFFCFGQRDVDLFVRHGHMVDNYFPVGSLVGSYYKSVVSVPGVRQRFDLCLISQWHEHFFNEITGDDFTAYVSRRVGTGIKGLNSFVHRLLEETDLSLVVCPRNDHDDAEVSFYKEAFGERARIAESDRKNFSTYRVVEQSRLVIALNSTTLAEVFSWGQKVLWCNVPNDVHYEMPEAGISYFYGDNYDEFKSHVLMLLSMPQEDYEMHTRDRARYINNYDLANPPHEIIRSAVITVLSKIN